LADFLALQPINFTAGNEIEFFAAPGRISTLHTHNTNDYLSLSLLSLFNFKSFAPLPVTSPGRTPSFALFVASASPTNYINNRLFSTFRLRLGI
jgi:hypothetical protein